MIKYQGRNIKNVYGFTKKSISDYEKNPIRYFYNESTDDVVKINVKDTKINTVKTINNAFGELIFKKWNIKRIDTKKVVQGIGKIKNVSVFKNLPANKTVKLLLSVKVLIEGSEDIERSKSFVYYGRPMMKDIENYLIYQLVPYLRGFGLLDEDQITNIDFDEDGRYEYNNVTVIYKVTSALKTNQTFSYDDDGRLREPDYYKIDDCVDNLIKFDFNENCIRSYLRLIHQTDTKRDISETSISRLGNKKGVLISELKDYCIKYNVKLLIYNFEGEIIESFYPPKQSYRKGVIGIAYNNHFYPITSKYLSKITPQKEEFNLLDEEDIMTEFKDLISKKIIPTNIKITPDFDNNKIEIYEFTHNDITYLNNKNYDKLKKLFKKIGLEDKLTPRIKLSKAYKLIEPLFNQQNDNTYSFFPVETTRSTLRYLNPTIKDYKNLVRIDKVKCFSYAIMNLPFLIVCDYRTAKIKNIFPNGYEIIDHYLYSIEIKKPNILLNDNNIYSGYHLNYCIAEGFEFKLIEEIECTKVDNYFKEMIRVLYNSCKTEEEHDLIKSMINRMIGQCEKNDMCEQSSYWKIAKICNFAEKQQDEDENYINYGKLFLKLVEEETTTISNIYNRRPIRYQVLDYANHMVYEKLQELDITHDKLYRINVDEITFVKTSKYNRSFIKSLNQLDINKWKKVEMPDLTDKEEHKKFTKGYTNITPYIKVSFYNHTIKISNENNTLYDSYAGCGKSYHIKNKLLPNLDDYIVLTPSHNALKIYKKDDINCKVIQTYEHGNALPKEQNIIIDEIGLCSKKAHEIIYKCFLLGKNIYSYGDFNQLLPVNEMSHCNSIQYHNIIYSKINNLKTNYRNDFTIDYYDQLINEKIDLVKEIKTHRTSKPENADIILCKTNKECERYNKLIGDQKNLNLESENADIICYTNNLRDKNIYNSFTYTIKKIKNDTVTLDDDTTITKKQLKDNFKLGYALTFYKCQGQEYKSFYVPNSSLKRITGREAYTIISRLKI
jgi:hypothetical protein